MSGRMSENRFTVANVSYGPHFPIIQGTYVKEIINWTGLNLCSYMQVGLLKSKPKQLIIFGKTPKPIKMRKTCRDMQKPLRKNFLNGCYAGPALSCDFAHCMAQLYLTSRRRALLFWCAFWEAPACQ